MESIFGRSFTRRTSIALKVLVVLILAVTGGASTTGFAEPASKISFPDTDTGLHVFSIDTHVHTVFSDGTVWPDVRVLEADREGIDGVVITDHIDTQLHGADIPNPNRNRAYQIAHNYAAKHFPKVLIFNGVEIARGPAARLGNYGHFNAIFISDANALRHREWRDHYPVEGAPLEDAIDAIAAAKKQGAFIIWNHPALQGGPKLFDIHRSLIKSGLIDGVEVARGQFYSEGALQIALDNDLAVVGASDLHAPSGITYNIPTAAGVPHDEQRTVTLVLTNDRSESAVLRAFATHRTVALQGHTLLGREAEVRPIVEAALTLKLLDASAEEGVIIRNAASTPFSLRLIQNSRVHITNVGPVIVVPAHGSVPLTLAGVSEGQAVTLQFDVLNAVVGYRQPLRIALKP